MSDRALYMIEDLNAVSKYLKMLRDKDYDALEETLSEELLSLEERLESENNRLAGFFARMLTLIETRPMLAKAWAKAVHLAAESQNVR